jgi:carbamoyltransferase
MITWGMVGNSHDASLAVFEDKKLLWAAMSKDFSGVLHDPDPDWTMLQVAIQSFGKPNKVVWYERPFLKTLRQWRAGQGWLYKDNDIRAYLKRWDISCKIEYTQHHLSHAAYAYYTQPFDDCAVICLDSIGEFETLTIWHGKNNKLRKIYSQGYPHSLGLFYSAMTQRMGFTPQRDEYLIAQHAKAGNAGRFMNVMLEEIIDIETRPIVKLKKNLHRGCLDWRPEIKTVQDIADLAATTQKVFEACVHVLSDYTKNETKSDNIALAGGGALNKLAIDGIRRDWKNVHVPQNPGDPGSCIGAVLAKTKTKVTLDKRWYQKV